MEDSGEYENEGYDDEDDEEDEEDEVEAGMEGEEEESDEGSFVVGNTAYPSSWLSAPTADISSLTSRSSTATFTSTSSSFGMSSTELVSSDCRVGDCSRPPVVAGLCQIHLEQFQSGSLPIDLLTLESSVMQRRRDEATAHTQAKAEAEAAAVAAAAAASLAAAGLEAPKKYFCRAEGCHRQTQKSGLCKRHYHEQEGTTVSASQKQQPTRRRHRSGKSTEDVAEI